MTLTAKQLKCEITLRHGARLTDSRPHDCINRALVIELYFCFGGMNIHVDMPRIEFDKQHIEWKAIVRQKSFKSIHDSVMKVVAADKPFVHEKKLFPAGLTGEIRFTHVTGHLYEVCLFLTSRKLLLVILSKKVNDPLTEFSCWQIINELVSLNERK